MYINPKSLIEQGIIKNVISQSQVQPNAVDFSLDSLFVVNSQSPCYISNDKSKNIMRSRTPVELIDLREKGHNFSALNPNTLKSQNPGWELLPNTYYDGTSDIYVEVPEGMVAYLVIRSTFNRNAVFLISGFYDSGFKGNIGFTIYNVSGHTYIEKGTMFGQIAFVKSDSEGVYAGGYNTDDGTHWSSLPVTAPIIEQPEIQEPVVQSDVFAEVTETTDNNTDTEVQELPTVSDLIEAVDTSTETVDSGEEVSGEPTSRKVKRK